MFHKFLELIYALRKEESKIIGQPFNAQEWEEAITFSFNKWLTMPIYYSSNFTWKINSFIFPYTKGKRKPKTRLNLAKYHHRCHQHSVVSQSLAERETWVSQLQERQLAAVSRYLAQAMPAQPTATHLVQDVVEDYEPSPLWKDKWAFHLLIYPHRHCWVQIQ